MNRRVDVLLFIVMVVFWAINYPLVKIALNYMNSYSLLFYRVLFSILGILFIFNKKLNLHLTRDEILPLFILSMLNVLIFMELWFMAESTISSSLSSIIIYTYPVTSTLLSIIILKESYSRFVFMGIIFGFTGVIVIFFNGLLSGLGIGVLIALAGSFSWSAGTIYYKKYLTGKKRETTNFYQFAFSLLPSFLIAAAADPGIGLITPPPIFLLIVAIIGIPGTAVAYYAFLHLNRVYKVSTISSFLFLVPAVSVVFGFIILKEIPTLYEVAGLILVSIGIIFSAKGLRK